MTKEQAASTLHPSRRIKDIEESQTIALTARAVAMRAAGIDVVSMTAGEPDFPTPDHIKAAAIDAINANFTRYTAVQGIPELVQAVVDKFRNENSLQFSPSQIVVTTGAKQAIINTLIAICDPGDEILISAPYWVSYPAMVRLAGGTPIIVPSGLDRGFRPHLSGLESAVTPRTKAIIVNSPSNPSALVYSLEEMNAIAEFAKRHNLLILSDEVYEWMLFDTRRHVSIGTLPAAADRTVTINGVSKSYSMTGWRIGFMGGPEEITRAAIKVQSQMTSNANSIAQKAAVAALNGPKDFPRMMMVEYQKRRDNTLAALRSIHGITVVPPEGAMFFFLSVKDLIGRRTDEKQITSSTVLVEYLLHRHHVALIPGEAFGDDTCLRMSFSCGIRDLEEGLKRIARGIRELQ